MRVFLEKTFEKRKKIYENLADITTQVDNKDIQEIAIEIKNKIDQINQKNNLKQVTKDQRETKKLYV